MSDEDSNNSSLNNLFGHFMHFADIGGQEYSLDEDHLVCFDTRNHRIGINTIDPTCSLDISGLNGKIIVNSISCEKLDVGEINVNNKLEQLDSSINSVTGTINNVTFLKEDNDASLANVDITGVLDLSSSNAKLNIVHIDNSFSSIPGTLYFDPSGFIKIVLNSSNKI